MSGKQQILSRACGANGAWENEKEQMLSATCGGNWAVENEKEQLSPPTRGVNEVKPRIALAPIAQEVL
eukprot:6959467-Lingulodinium_polyedra.AAC.1